MPGGEFRRLVHRLYPRPTPRMPLHMPHPATSNQMRRINHTAALGVPIILPPTAPLTPPSSGVSWALRVYCGRGAKSMKQKLGGAMEDNQGHGFITDPLPPETSTPMPPTLVHAYDRHLGWPGRAADDPGFAPIQVKPHIAWSASQWPTFAKKLSDRTPTITP